MKKLSYLLLLLILPVFFSSCEDLNLNTGLSEEEIIDGLKTALVVGTDTSVTVTSAVDGYYGDQQIKIPLPPQADIITNNLNNPLLQEIGLDVMVEEVVMRINRSAEDAASEAAPIFKDAITTMSFTDAMSILEGQNPEEQTEEFDSSAATNYLVSKTSQQLIEAFAPKINASLDKPLVGNVSTTDSWDELTGAYNQVANTLAGQLAGLTPVEVDLGEFVTQKALDGLFLKVGEEEQKIRRDPYQWASDILQKVFG